MTVTLQDTGDVLVNTQILNSAIMNGGKIFIDGPYPVTKTGIRHMIDMRGANGVEITGTCPESEVIWDITQSPTSPSQDLYMFYTDTTTYDVAIHDLRINGSWDEMNNPANGAQYHIFNLLGGERITLENLNVFNYLGDAFRCLSGLIDLNVRNNYVRHGGRSGISGKGISTRLTIAYNDVDDVQDQAFDWEDTTATNIITDAKILFNNFRGQDGHIFAPICRGNWLLQGNNIHGLAKIRGFGDVVFENNHIVHNARFKVDGADGLIIRNNTFDTDVGVPEEKGALLIEKNITKILVEGNRINFTGPGSGIFIIDGKDVVIKNNEVNRISGDTNYYGIGASWIVEPIIDQYRIVDNTIKNSQGGVNVTSVVNKWNGVCAFLEISANRAYATQVPTFDINLHGGTVNKEVKEGNMGWLS